MIWRREISAVRKRGEGEVYAAHLETLLILSLHDRRIVAAGTLACAAVAFGFQGVGAADLEADAEVCVGEGGREGAGKRGAGKRVAKENAKVSGRFGVRRSCCESCAAGDGEQWILPRKAPYSAALYNGQLLTHVVGDESPELSCEDDDKPNRVSWTAGRAGITCRRTGGVRERLQIRARSECSEEQSRERTEGKREVEARRESPGGAS